MAVEWTRPYVRVDGIPYCYSLLNNSFIDGDHKAHTLENQKKEGRSKACGIVYQIGNDSISKGSISESELAMELTYK